MDALLVGWRTVLFDDVSLRVPPEDRRLKNGRIYPLRIIVLGKEEISPNQKIFDKNLGGTLIFAGGEHSIMKNERHLKEVEIIVCGSDFSIEPRKLCEKLARDYEVNKMLIEGGPTIIGSFLEADLIDRFYITICPYLFGGKKEEVLTPISGWGVKSAEERRYKLMEVEKSQDWSFLRYDRRTLNSD
jgi:5-amino-6-(5-phosphoribosylamino)uracil reductase